LIDEPTAKLLTDNGIWWSLQPFLDDEDASPLENPVSQKKALEVFAGTDNAYKLAKKYNIKTAFGTDILFDARLTARQGAILAAVRALVRQVYGRGDSPCRPPTSRTRQKQRNGD
jgi:imidazolonepropionase-like amidohydrolase